MKLKFTPYWPAEADRRTQGVAIGKFADDVLVADVRLVLDQLQEMNLHDHFWHGHLDLSKIGIHSLVTRLSELRAGECSSINVSVIRVPGKMIFVTEELVQSLHQAATPVTHSKLAPDFPRPSRRPVPAPASTPAVRRHHRVLKETSSEAVPCRRPAAALRMRPALRAPAKPLQS